MVITFKKDRLRTIARRRQRRGQACGATADDNHIGLCNDLRVTSRFTQKFLKSHLI
jgi:hypothetical protein